VVLHGVRADEQPGADLRVGQAVAGEPRHEQFLRSELLVPRPGTTLASGFAGGAQLAPGPFGEARHAGRLEHAVGGAQLLARGTAAAFAAQPLPVQQVRAGQLGPEAGAAQPAGRLAVPVLGVLAVAEQRPAARVDPLPPVGLADARRLGQPAERVRGQPPLPGPAGRLDQLGQRPHGDIQLGRLLARPLRLGNGRLIAAEPVAQDGGNQLRILDP